MRRSTIVLGVVVVSVCAGCASNDNGPTLQTVSYVDLARYVGDWFEIARTPNDFQEDCVGTTAYYSLRGDGRVAVTNRCREDALRGEEKSICGVARVVDKETNAKLKVTFFWPFEGDYWIIDLDPSYRWAVVGEPRRRYLWILSRTPTLDAHTYDAILARLPDAGYDPTRLLRTPQPPGGGDLIPPAEQRRATPAELIEPEWSRRAAARGSEITSD
jgi:apolipoprotein D and lipocalin family protein